MTDRRPKLLFDALSAIDAARSFATGKSIEQYEADLLLRSAVNLTVLRTVEDNLPGLRVKLSDWLAAIQSAG